MTKKSNKIIVVTRALGDEGEMLHLLQDAGYHAIHEPITEIFLEHTARSELANALRSNPDAVLITSAHGARALALLSEVRDIFLLCVGEKTGEIAADLGFTRVCVAGENVDKMLEYISEIGRAHV